MSEPQLPTEEELAKLTPRAMVAYACRAARRVQPLYFHDDRQNMDMIDEAISFAELIARGSPATTSVDAVQVTARATTVANTAPGSTSGARACRSAVHAAVAARAADVGDTAEVIADATRAAKSAALAAAVARSNAEYEVIRVAQGDVERLQKLLSDGADDLLDVLGPLWPDGEPEWYRIARGRILRPTNVAIPEPHIRIEPVEMEGSGLYKVHSNKPVVFIAWSPEFINEDEYARLISLLGDLVREEGGAGIRRLKSKGFGVPVMEGALR